MIGLSTLAALAAVAPLQAAEPTQDTRAQSVQVEFGGQFDKYTPKTKFSAPGARFSVKFAVPRVIPRNANQFTITYKLASRTSEVPVYFNVSDNKGQPQGFTLSLNDGSSGSATNIVFFADDFFERRGKRLVSLIDGPVRLFDGYTVSTSLGGAGRNPIVNPTTLKVQPKPVNPSR